MYGCLVGENSQITNVLSRNAPSSQPAIPPDRPTQPTPKNRWRRRLDGGCKRDEGKEERNRLVVVMRATKRRIGGVLCAGLPFIPNAHFPPSLCARNVVCARGAPYFPLFALRFTQSRTVCLCVYTPLQEHCTLNALSPSFTSALREHSFHFRKASCLCVERNVRTSQRHSPSPFIEWERERRRPKSLEFPLNWGKRREGRPRAPAKKADLRH